MEKFYGERRIHTTFPSRPKNLVRIVCSSYTQRETETQENTFFSFPLSHGDSCSRVTKLSPAH